MSTQRFLALIRGGGGQQGDQLVEMLAALEELNMALTLGSNGPWRLSEVCPGLVTLLGGPAAALSSEIVSVVASWCWWHASPRGAAVRPQP